jgi:hypothetical protein
MSDWNLRICLVGLVVARPSARRLSNDQCTTGAGYAANSVSRPTSPGLQGEGNFVFFTATAP